jgi:HTH-type transcriptional regulator/antitoxin HigA
VKPIRTERDNDVALKKVERLWGAKKGTSDGDRLDKLATLIEAYEDKHYPMGSAKPVRKATRP